MGKCSDGTIWKLSNNIPLHFRADFVINYKTDPTWGETAKELTGGVGVQHVVEVGGESTMSQSFAAASIGCVISVIGYIGGDATATPATFIDCLKKACIVRGIQIGSRSQLENMVRAVEANNIKPQLDHRTFKLEGLKEAYKVRSFQSTLTAHSRLTDDSTKRLSNISVKSVSRSIDWDCIWPK